MSGSQHKNLTKRRSTVIKQVSAFELYLNPFNSADNFDVRRIKHFNLFKMSTSDNNTAFNNKTKRHKN